MMMTKLTKVVAMCATMTAISSLSMLLLMKNASAAELKINVNSIDNTNGYLLVALYAGQESYTSGKMQFSARVKVNGEQEQVVFSDLPDGEYAVKLFHDENDNKELDKNMLGIPSEGYGFSNNKGRFGQPKYQEASFNVQESTMIDINMF